MRLAGGLLLFAACLSSGFYAGRAARKKCVILSECLNLVRLFATSISYADERLKSIILSAAESGEFKNLSFINALVDDDFSMGFSTAWNKAIDLQPHLNKKSSQLMKAFGLHLGKTDTESQMELCHRYEKELEYQYNCAINSEREQIKNYRLAGTAVGVILLILAL